MSENQTPNAFEKQMQKLDESAAGCCIGLAKIF